MENLSNTTPTSHPKMPPPIMMDLEDRPTGADEFSIDHLKFKAINAGLGFHQEVRGSDLRFKRPLRSTATMPSRQRTFVPPTPRPNTLTTAMPQIKTRTAVTAQPAVALAKTASKTPSKALQFMAWVIDLASVLTCFAFTLGVFFLTSGLSFSQFLAFMQRQDFQIFAFILLAIYYVVYFSILDLVGSFGKSYLGIKVLTKDLQRPRFWHTLRRTLVVMGSWLLLGIPCLFDGQGKLSQTKLVLREQI